MFLQKLRALLAAPPHSRFVFALIFLLHGGFILGVGLINSPDSGTYSRWADQLIAVHFNYAEYAKRISFVIPPLFYAGWVTLVAIIKLVCGSYWQQAIIFINLLAHCGVGVLVVQLTYRITRQAGAAWLSLLIFCIAFDIFNWPRYVLSDSTFLCLSFTLFFLLSGLLIGDESKSAGHSAKPRNSTRFLPLIILCPLALLWRPTGVLLFAVVFAGVFLLLRERARAAKQQEGNGSLASRAGQKRMIAVSVVLLCVLGFWLGHAALVQQPERWPFRALSGAIQRNAEDYAQGTVLHGRRDTYHVPPVSLGDYALISADRFKHFFHPVYSGFSRSHKILSLLFFMPVYLFGSIALALWLTAKTGLGRREESILTLLFGCVLIFALFHSVTQLDYDWRYRLPVLPHFIVIAATGFAMLSNKRTGS